MQLVLGVNRFIAFETCLSFATLKMFGKVLIGLVLGAVYLGCAFAKPSDFDLAAEETKQYEEGNYY